MNLFALMLGPKYPIAARVACFIYTLKALQLNSDKNQIIGIVIITFCIKGKAEYLIFQNDISTQALLVPTGLVMKSDRLVAK